VQKATDYIGSLILENDILQFIQTAEGRVVPKTVDGVDKNEYQYHLKDHLGNVRTTFAVRDDDFAADFEKVMVDGVMRHYNPYFNNYDTITILNNPLKRSGNYTHRLAGGGSDVVGLMKTLYVSKGDKVSAEVYGKYLDVQFSDEAINGGALINALVTMLGGGAISGEGTVVQNNLNSDYISAAMADGSQESSPKAYLNYILFDKNFSYLNSGFERLAASAADPGDGSGTHQKLSFEEIQIEEDGYLMVFLSNESQQEVEVFWDDFKVAHHYNAVLQADDYYPFGLTFNSYQRSYSKANNFKYNGKEGQEGTGWYDYGARNYDASLGRWFNIDPLAERAVNWTPYRYAFNNPLRFIDPDGRFELDKETAEKYPELKKFLQDLASNFENKSQEFKNAFYETSGLNEEQTMEMLTYGSGPLLQIEDLDGKDRNGDGKPDKVNGEAWPEKDEEGNIQPANNGKGLVKLDDDVVGKYEYAKTNGEKQVGSILVESTLLHEGTHFGNFKVNGNGNGKFRESGKAFEKKAYGQDIGRSSVKKYWDSKQLKRIKPMGPTVIPVSSN